jgi:hypothetical protein
MVEIVATDADDLADRQIERTAVQITMLVCHDDSLTHWVDSRNGFDAMQRIVRQGGMSRNAKKRRREGRRTKSILEVGINA